MFGTLGGTENPSTSHSQWAVEPRGLLQPARLQRAVFWVVLNHSLQDIPGPHYAGGLLWLQGPQLVIMVPTRELGVQIVMLIYKLFGGAVNSQVPGDAANMFTYKGPRGLKVHPHYA